jgi:multidrug efflux pump subunit AcrA (membrane-fusion protein)
MDQSVSTVVEVPDHFFKRTSSAKETAGDSRRLRLGRALEAAGVIALLVVAGIYGDYYWTTGRFLVSTDDAHVQAHSVLISPKVSGYISEVPVDDNQSVKAGAVLARIDPRDYQTALDQARANVAVAQEHVSVLEPATRNRLADLQQYFLSHGFPDPAGAMHRAIIGVGQIIRAQATIMGYADAFGLLGVALIIAILPVALLRKGTAAGGGAH